MKACSLPEPHRFCALNFLRKFVTTSPADSIDANSMLDVLDGEHAGQLRKSTLGRAVSGDRWKAEKACVGAGIYDGTTLVWDHRAYRFARVEEHSRQVNGENPLPFLKRHFHHALIDNRGGVVHQDIEFVEAFECERDHFLCC